MNGQTGRSRWWYGLRGFAFVLLGGGLGAFTYGALTHRPGAMPWGGMFFGAVVCGVLGAAFPPRRRRPR
ncbi:hypothetical protein [Streptomyces broussonetiae]|uniref:Uncharacterized protein n=1 Tax=Streptomyces broussonetiae TaxID=2686304 RepID=A0A6I6N3F9_9ACTN|nr:hypothetical protein [Streptomyces broussonetiae]QHA05974.1 hypothetical protein GQF42_24180 [Streptomyces broussonetiae]